MHDSQYDRMESEFLVDGFSNGFRLGYDGPRNVKIESNNLHLRVGDNFDLWNKIMIEVEAKRYSGPYSTPDEVFPDCHMINPIGLVEKPGKPGKTRLINHYSYPPGSSVNDFIPDNYSKVHYQDFQDAITIALDLLRNTEILEPDLHFSKTDAVNAFRVLPISYLDRCFQMLKAKNPLTKKWSYFVDLNCGFGSSSSCFLYDKVSRLLRHLYKWKTGMEAVVYLDDGLQMGLSETLCNRNLDTYLNICREINLPTSDEKTVRATRVINFLGLLIDAIRKLISIPAVKVSKALNLMDQIIDAKKTTVLHMQRITGLLNFFCRAIVPGRTFTRRMYAYFAHLNMKPHYHLRVTNEMRFDLGVWRSFLAQDQAVLRPFANFDTALVSTCEEIIWTSDAAKSPELGFAACYWHKSTNTIFYAYDQWEPGLIEKYDPSVQSLELVALTVGIFLFSERLANDTVTLWCDNQAVIQMVENGSSSCKHCMKLIRLIVLCALKRNIVYRVKFLASKDNRASDLLSRLKVRQFLDNLPRRWKAQRINIPKQLMPIKKFLE